VRPYLHELVKMLTAATTAGLFAAHWTSPLTAATIGTLSLWLLLARAG